MPFGAVLPVRLDDETDRRLEAVAVQTGTTKSGIIRMLARSFVDQMVSEDGRVTLPPNWRTILDVADGRSQLPGRRPDKPTKPAQKGTKPKKTPLSAEAKAIMALPVKTVNSAGEVQYPRVDATIDALLKDHLHQKKS